jgi:hypothetical protein
MFPRFDLAMSFQGTVQESGITNMPNYLRWLTAEMSRKWDIAAFPLGLLLTPSRVLAVPGFC